MKKKIILLRNRISRVVAICLFYIFRVFKIKDKIIITNYFGKGYGDNAKYIVEALVKKRFDKPILWVVSSYDIKLPDYVIPVKNYSLKWLYEMVTSKVWINNSRFPHYIRKRKNQKYIQVWHGVMPIKKIEYDAQDKLSNYYMRCVKNDNKIIDYLVSNGKHTTELYKNAFKYTGNIVELGVPRNDIFYKYNNEMIENIRRILKIKKDEIVILYAPTFRDNYDHNPYDINYEELKMSVTKKYGKKCKILVRFHPVVDLNKINFKDNDDIINVTNYNDMQQLIICSDFIITDYSSLMFDGLIAKKKVVLYIKDLDIYECERGLYFNLRELPFPLTKNNDELLDAIIKNNYDDMQKKYDEYMKSIGSIDDAYSSDRNADFIIDLFK